MVAYDTEEHSSVVPGLRFGQV